MNEKRIISRYEDLVKDINRLEHLTKEEVIALHFGFELMDAGTEPTFKKTRLIDDLRGAIKANKDIRMTKELYDKIMKINKGTVVMITQEIHKGIIIYDVTPVEDIGDVL